MNQLDFLKENVPCYIYDGEAVTKQCRKLKKAFSGFDILYSIKTNPFPDIIKAVSKEGLGADVASSGEVELAAENGIAPENIFYSSPGKTDWDIGKCYGKCVLIADSQTEIMRINKTAARRGEIAEIGLRVNPDFSMEDEQGCPSKFGIDAELLLKEKTFFTEYSNIRIVGIHIHIKSQMLDAGILAKYYQKCFALAKKIHEMEGVNIKFINFGSGIGALYREDVDQPIDLKKLSCTASYISKENAETLNARLLMETGRFIVCNAGKYYTRIVDIKESMGEKYLIVENGMNGFMRPAIANLLLKAAGKSLPGYEPLYTCQDEFSVRVLNQEKQKEKVHIVGNLCTALDSICENVEISRTRIGDIIEITNAGSYGYSLSPVLFSSQALAGQYCLLSGDKNI